MMEAGPREVVPWGNHAVLVFPEVCSRECGKVHEKVFRGQESVGNAEVCQVRQVSSLKGS